ncbi:SAM-dependent methyltransferase, partial [Actinomadura adrarensis]
MPDHTPVPPGIDVTRPSSARVYDYLLGGKDNYQPDREVAEQVLQLAPELKNVAVENRRFLIRVVKQLAGQGFDQFIDLGSGLPTQENVHEVAQSINPDARVVYVDRDPLVLAHAQALLGSGRNNVAYVHADIRDLNTVLGDIEERQLIDFRRPVVLLLVAVLHFVADADGPAGLVA